MNADAVAALMRRHEEIIKKYEDAPEAFDRILNSGIASGIWYSLMILGYYHEADECQQALINARNKRMRNEGIL